MAAEVKKSGKMTVFKTDRHEDWAAMGFVALIITIVLVYMAFIVPTIAVSAPFDGKIVEVKAKAGDQVKKGDVLYSIEMKEKKYVEGAVQEKVVTKDVKAKANGKVTEIKAKPGDAVKKDKSTILVLDHEKGTLP
jgi:biotin carboxyl carrier protein